MAKPPKTPPSSQFKGVHRDEVRNTDAAIESGQDVEDLARAREESAGRPDYSGEESRDERSD